jgi:hypothetical protein
MHMPDYPEITWTNGGIAAARAAAQLGLLLVGRHQPDAHAPLRAWPIPTPA